MEIAAKSNIRINCCTLCAAICDAEDFEWSFCGLKIQKMLNSLVGEETKQKCKISIWALREIWLHTSANVKGHHNKGHYPEKAVPFCLLSLDWPPLHTLPVQDTKYQGFVHEYSRHPHCQVRLKRQSMHRGKPKLNKQMSVNKWNVETITSSWLNSDTSIFHITFLKETMLYKVHLKKKKRRDN